jgi:hypothetical protein
VVFVDQIVEMEHVDAAPGCVAGDHSDSSAGDYSSRA